MQKVYALFDNELKTMEIPAPEEQVMPGIKWGRFENLFTPAFWASQSWMAQNTAFNQFRLGKTLSEEICCCILGGYGIPAEVGLAAFEKLRKAGVFENEQMQAEKVILELLSAPLEINNRQVRYRFANQKAGYLAAALSFLQNASYQDKDELEFRSMLLKIKGIGPKTASWIIRNWFASDKVAILDIHIIRAGRLIGLFKAKETPEKDYFSMEDKFLNFASAINTKPSLLDAVIWLEMKSMSRAAI